MLIAGLVLAAVGAGVHAYIFWLESLAWTGPRARRIFGTSPAEAATTAQLAFNQGFYNLFLAVDVLVGIGLVLAGMRAVGLTAVLIGAGSMAAAAVVLVASDRRRPRPALVQGTAPALAVLLIVLGVTL